MLVHCFVKTILLSHFPKVLWSVVEPSQSCSLDHFSLSEFACLEK